MGEHLPFMDYVGRQFGADSARIGMPAFFNSYSLPEPKDEYLEIKNGALVPLDDYGLMLRVERSEFRPWDMDSPYVLQPLIFFRLDSGVHAGLYPGTNSIGVTPEDHEALCEGLMRTGYFCVGDRDDDCGYIGPPSARFPRGFPVVLDTNDLVSTRELAKIRLTTTGDSGGFDFDQMPVNQWYQYNFYGKVRSLAYKVLSTSDPGIQNRAAKKFWHECYEASHEPMRGGAFRLRASWQDAGNEKTKDRPVAQTGAAYRELLQQSDFHAAVLH